MRSDNRLYDTALRFLHHPQGYKSKKEIRKEVKLKKKLDKKYRKGRKIGILGDY